MKLYSTSIAWFVLLITTMFFSFCGKNANKTTDNINPAVQNFKFIVYDTPVVAQKKFHPHTLIPFCDSIKWGYANVKGDIVIECQFEQASFFSEGLAFVKKNGKFGFIDSTGKLAIDLIYDDASYFSFGMAPVKKNTFWGFIDKTGKEILPCKYEEFKLYDNENFHVKQNNQWGTVEQGGIQKILPLYDQDFTFSNNRAIVQRKFLYGIIDTAGKTIVECKYNSLSKVTDSLYIYRIDYKYGLMTLSEKQLIQPKYDILTYAGDSTLIAGYTRADSYSNYNYQLINFKDSAITKMIFNDIKIGKTNLLLARGNILYGFISLKGDTIIPFMYSNAQPFNSNITQVKQNGKYGMINYKNEPIIPFEYQSISNETQKYIKVYKNNKFGIVTREGNKITDCIYTDVDQSYSEYAERSNFGTFSNGLAAVAKDCNVGFINEEGKEITPFQFHWASNFSDNGMAIVKFNELYGLINKDGKIIADIKYEDIKEDKYTQYYYTTLTKKVKNGSNTTMVGYFGLDGKAFFNSEYTLRTPFSTDSIIKLIREKFKTINSSLDSSESYKISDTLSGTLYKNKLVIIDKQANYSYEYYYDKYLNPHGPFFALITNNNEKTADRYYFLNSIMIKHIDKNNENVPVCDAPYAKEDDIHFTARKHLADFYNAKALSKIPNYQKTLREVKQQMAEIDNNIAKGIYQRVDNYNTSMGCYSTTTETYVDENNREILVTKNESSDSYDNIHTTYYIKGIPIYSLSKEGYHGEPHGYRNKWDEYYKKEETFGNITFITTDCIGCNAAITVVR